ncbi:unnamed protein product [Wuchereria bancrofti]|uniref:Uncharacterized protein n=1 Tax=Wuchereria bancrofti TaxID=6293 RepID=A0A3P7EIE7_WUCBA|nr:unnamed protein product [Wuchereria bancrofti]
MMFFTMTCTVHIIKSTLKEIQLMKYGNMICLNAKKVKKLRLHMFRISYRLL